MSETTIKDIRMITPGEMMLEIFREEIRPKGVACNLGDINLKNFIKKETKED